MPQTARVTYLFSGRAQGWGESYVYPISDSLSPEQAYNTIFYNIAQLRAQMLAREYTLDAVRVQVIYNSAGVPIKRVGITKNPGFTPAIQTAVNAGEQPNACVLIQFTDVQGQRKKKTFIGGPPDAIFTDGGVYQGAEAANWASRYSAWAQAQFAASAGWLEDVPTGPGLNITSITSNPNLTKSVAVDGELFDAGEVDQQRVVRIKGVNGKSVYNGQWIVHVDGISNFTTVDAFAAAPYAFGGIATAYTYPKPVAVATTVQVQREGTHKRGRPLLATRGRLAAQPRL